MGQDISAKLRERFGVVQDRAVHKYVTLVGTAVASMSDKANKPWTFVVLDTDGINAFAAPGGFIHITKGALALIKNEAELADVLAHEIVHVTKDHTINAIRKSKTINLAAGATRQQVVKRSSTKVRCCGEQLRSQRGKKADKEGVTWPTGGLIRRPGSAYSRRPFRALQGREEERAVRVAATVTARCAHQGRQRRFDGKRWCRPL